MHSCMQVPKWHGYILAAQSSVSRQRAAQATIGRQAMEGRQATAGRHEQCCRCLLKHPGRDPSGLPARTCRSPPPWPALKHCVVGKKVITRLSSSSWRRWHDITQSACPCGSTQPPLACSYLAPAVSAALAAAPFACMETKWQMWHVALADLKHHAEQQRACHRGQHAAPATGTPLHHAHTTG